MTKAAYDQAHSSDSVNDQVASLLGWQCAKGIGLLCTAKVLACASTCNYSSEAALQRVQAARPL